tara:strand:- start:1057 stop:1545 length:489 start_codon:yes stop_codon:yes gene_type:complete
MTDNLRDLDPNLSARIRRLAAGGSETDMAKDGKPLELTAVAAPDEEPLLLTERASGAASASAGREAQRQPPLRPTAASPADHSISGTLAKLDARKADLEAGNRPNAIKAATPTVSDRPLDELVLEAVRPMVADWLDGNLERIVREEVAKAVAARQGDDRAAD